MSHNQLPLLEQAAENYFAYAVPYYVLAELHSCYW